MTFKAVYRRIVCKEKKITKLSRGISQASKRLERNSECKSDDVITEKEQTCAVVAVFFVSQKKRNDSLNLEMGQQQIAIYKNMKIMKLRKLSNSGWVSFINVVNS